MITLCPKIFSRDSVEPSLNKRCWILLWLMPQTNLSLNKSFNPSNKKLIWIIIFAIIIFLSGAIKPFEAPQRSVKIKLWVNFFSSSGIVTRRVNESPYSQYLSTFSVLQQILKQYHLHFLHVIWNSDGFWWRGINCFNVTKDFPPGFDGNVNPLNNL